MFIRWCNLETRLQGHAHRYHRDKDTSRSDPDCAFQCSTHLLAHTSAVPGAPPSEVNLKKRHKSPGRCAKKSIHRLYSSQQPAWSVAKSTRTSAGFFVVQIVNLYIYMLVQLGDEVTGSCAQVAHEVEGEGRRVDCALCALRTKDASTMRGARGAQKWSDLG